jgi:hypothetical protein
VSDAGASPEFVWRTTKDVDAVYALHLASLSTEPPYKVRTDGREHFEIHMGEGGWVTACFLASGPMVAYGLLALQLPSVGLMAGILGVDASTLCTIDGMAVHPSWRGRRLHEVAIDRRLRHAASLGRTAGAATVAPWNVHSLRGMLRVGFEVRRLAFLYGGQPRFLVHRAIADGLPARQAQPRHTELSLPVADVPGHQAALATGRVGHGCHQDLRGEWFVDYGPPSPSC